MYQCLNPDDLNERNAVTWGNPQAFTDEVNNEINNKNVKKSSRERKGFLPKFILKSTLTMVR